VKSFAKYNPDWAIKVWTPIEMPANVAPWTTGEQMGQYAGHDYLIDLPYLYRESINMRGIGIPNDIPEVHKSDLLRWFLLGTYGGVWSDFDILYTSPLSDSIIGGWNGPGLCRYILPISDIDTKYFQAIGFLASAGTAGKDFFWGMFQRGLSKIPQTKYQAFGATMLEKEHLPEWEASGRSVFYLDKDLVYPYYSHTDVQNYFYPVQLHHPNSIGLHWYAGHPVNGPKAATITEANIREKANEYSICREALRVI